MKVLITGGAGYIGSHTNRYFAKMGAETIVLDNLSNGHEEVVKWGTLVKGDIGDEKLLDMLLASEKCDAIIDFAGFISVGESVTDPAKYYENNVMKMKTLLDAAVRHGVKYFVFSSSAAIFGEPSYVPIDEEHAKNPINPYGKTKLIGEMMLADYGRAYGLCSCPLRYFNAAGDSEDALIGEAHSPESHLIPLVLRATRTKKPMKVFGTDYDTRDGSCIRDYIHVDDLAEAHYLGLKYIMAHNKSEAFNLGSSDGMSVLELIKEAERVTGENVPYDVAPRRSGDPAELIASNKKARELLGWTPKHSDVKTILRDAWNWECNRKY